jgi:hypothetical protein
VTTLFDVLADGLGRTYFDELEGQGFSVTTAGSAVAVSASAAGVVLADANAEITVEGVAMSVGGSTPGVANASVSISAACVDNLTYVYIAPRVARVEIFGTAGQVGTPRAVSTVVISSSAIVAALAGTASAAVVASANAQALCFGVASASVVISGTAAGNGLIDQFTSPATATMAWTAGAAPRSIGRANATVSALGAASGAISISIGVARGTVAINAQAAEAAGVIEFPRASASISIRTTGVAKAIASPSRHLYEVTGRSIDWKTITDAYNSQQPPVPEYEFGYGKARRTFKSRS